MDIFAPSHLLVLLVIILIIFGPSKLGDVGGALGKAIKDFKRAMNDPDVPEPAGAEGRRAKTPGRSHPDQAVLICRCCRAPDAIPAPAKIGRLQRAPCLF